jgi:hypothetical protein
LLLGLAQKRKDGDELKDDKESGWRKSYLQFSGFFVAFLKKGYLGWRVNPGFLDFRLVYRRPLLRLAMFYIKSSFAQPEFHTALLEK